MATERRRGVEADQDSPARFVGVSQSRDYRQCVVAHFSRPLTVREAGAVGELIRKALKALNSEGDGDDMAKG